MKLLFFFFIGNREAAIVTELPGTTRDLIQVSLDVSGYSVILIDTAGIRSQTKDLIEKLGIKKSRDLVQQADMVILVIDVQNLLEVDNMDILLQKYSQNMNVQCQNCLIYVNKIDTVSNDQVFRLRKISKVSNWAICFGSCKIDKGLTDMMESFENYLQKLLVIFRLFFLIYFIKFCFNLT